MTYDETLTFILALCCLGAFGIAVRIGQVIGRPRRCYDARPDGHCIHDGCGPDGCPWPPRADLPVARVVQRDEIGDRL